jgi:hypothetical protein
MNTLRSTVMAVATCGAALSLTACTAAGTTAGPAKPASPAGSRTASSSATAAPQTAPGCASSGGLVTVNAPLGSFPIPPGAQVVENISAGKLIAMVLSSVTPSQMSGFYTSALPRAGYKITGNEQDTGSAAAIVEILFAGHGYMGVAAAASGLGKVPSPPRGASVRICPGVRLSSISKNVVWISLASH